MILFLTSSPCIEGSPAINPANRFIDNLKRTIRENARVVFISALPSDPGFSDYCMNSMCDGLQKAGLRFASTTSLDTRSANKAASLIENSDFIIMGGGHVPTQNAFLQKINLRKLMTNYKGAVMGISAGSMNCADIVYAQPEEKGESIDPNYHRFINGLGLTKTQILPHYQKVCNNILDNRRLFEDITYNDSYGHKFFVLVDGSYILQENGVESVWGESWTIQDGILNKVCEAGCRKLLSEI